MASSGDNVNKYMTSRTAKTLKSNVCQRATSDTLLKIGEKSQYNENRTRTRTRGYSVPQHLRVEVRQGILHDNFFFFFFF